MSKIYSDRMIRDLVNSLERAGYSVEDINNLTESSNLWDIKAVLDNKASIIYPEHVADSNLAPSTCENYYVKSHRPDGLVKLEPHQSIRVRFESQKDYMSGYDLRDRVYSMKTMNATILDDYLKHQEFIPRAWKYGVTVFFGTIYSESGNLESSFVRCLVWLENRDEWHSYYCDLCREFNFEYFVPLLEKPDRLSSSILLSD